MIPSLTGSLTNTKPWSLYGDVGEDGLFILWFNVVWVDVRQPKWQKALKLIWGCRPRWPVYIWVKCYVGIVVPQPNWHTVYDVSFFGGIAQCRLFIFILKFNDGAVVPQPNCYQDWFLIRGSRLHILCINQHVMAHKPHWTASCGALSLVALLGFVT